MIQLTHPAGHSINGIYPLNDLGEARTSFKQDTNISFEIFPATTAAGRHQLLAEVSALTAARPEYISVTYGAGGSNKQGSLETAKSILADTDTEVMAHLTFSGQSRSQVMDSAQLLKAAGIHHLLALRGDSPKQQTPAQSPPFKDTISLSKHWLRKAGLRLKQPPILIPTKMQKALIRILTGYCKNSTQAPQKPLRNFSLMLTVFSGFATGWINMVWPAS